MSVPVASKDSSPWLVLVPDRMGNEDWRGRRGRVMNKDYATPRMALMFWTKSKAGNDEQVTIPDIWSGVGAYCCHTSWLLSFV